MHDKTPSERYAAARHRVRYPQLARFRAGYPFPLDDFQVEAAQNLEDGYAVLVCAPTGAGKTVVGEFAVHLALAGGQKCFYTTPIKALSNQKYNDLVVRHGAAQVGLLTGDNAINSEAPVVVMTTEVLRNMLYAGSDTVANLGYVVMDEVHYLGDRFRGGVWEEVIIHLPASVRLVSLSATVSNAEEFGQWLQSVRGETTVIVHEERPVPLWQHMLVGRRLFDLFADDGHTLSRDLAAEAQRRSHQYPSGRGRDRRHGDRRGAGRWRPPYRPDVISKLDAEGLLPVITFIFSRAGCDAAVEQCVSAGLWLTTEDERAEIETVADQRTADIPAADLDVLGFWEWREGLRRGVAAHHAGLIPVFKQTVEELFTRGLVQAVFATETLALGINMPARSVCLERLTKFNGESHAEITPGEYTQLTGRAGRRGIDVEGHAVVLWAPDVEPTRVAGLASTRTYPLRSSFAPSYNMAVNLVAQMGRAAGRSLLENSFAQFQADRGIGGLTAQIRKLETTRDEYAAKMTCERGDFADYAMLRRRLSDRESELARANSQARRERVAESLQSLRPGDVIHIPSGRRAGVAVVLDARARPGQEPHPLVVTEARWAGRIAAGDFTAPADVLARMRLPKHVNHRSPAERRDLASRLAALDLPQPVRRRRAGSTAGDDALIIELRAALRRHPCHGCPDRERHARWGDRFSRAERDIDTLRRRIDGRRGSLGRTFDRICSLLDELGYLDGDAATDAGRQLARVWSESDLLVTECLRSGAWETLSPPELAAIASAMVYEARREDFVPVPPPTPALRDALAATSLIWGRLAERESAAGLPTTREPELAFLWPTLRWARGESLERVLLNSAEHGQPLSAGDFIRWSKQVIDLLDQIAAAPEVPPSLSATARGAGTALRRGVVAQSLQV